MPQIKNLWSRAESCRPDFLSVYSDGQRKENEIRLTGYRKKIDEQLSGFPHISVLPGKRKRWKDQTERMLDVFLWNEPLLGLPHAMAKKNMEGFKAQAKVFMKRVRKFDPALGMTDIGQALRNYIVYATFLELNRLPQHCSSAIFGYSMLYPYTDNFIDDPNRTVEEKQHYNQMIADIILGSPYEALSEHEMRTASLLNNIIEEYGRDDMIFDGLYNMLDAQKISLDQSDAGKLLNRDDILTISIYKGGISVLIDRYFINQSFNSQDLVFYFGFGFLLQLCDDLQDIAKDGHEGSHTLFTCCDSRQETEESINQLIYYTRDLFFSYQSKNEVFKEFLFQNTCLLILLSAVGSKEFLSDNWCAWIEERMPVSAAWLAASGTSLLAAEEQKAGMQNHTAARKFISMLDMLLE